MPIKKTKPPVEKKARQNWDATRNWKKTWAKREQEHSIFPEFVQHWRPMILGAYRKNGIEGAKTECTRCTKFFENLAAEGKITQENANGIIENFESFLKAIENREK